MASAGSQQLRAQHPAPSRRCGVHSERGEQGIGDGSEDEYGNEPEVRDGGGSGNRSENGDDIIEMRVEGRKSFGTCEGVKRG